MNKFMNILIPFFYKILSIRFTPTEYLLLFFFFSFLLPNYQSRPRHRPTLYNQNNPCNYEWSPQLENRQMNVVFKMQFKILHLLLSNTPPSCEYANIYHKHALYGPLYLARFLKETSANTRWNIVSVGVYIKKSNYCICIGIAHNTIKPLFEFSLRVFVFMFGYLDIWPTSNKRNKHGCGFFFGQPQDKTT